MRCGQSEYQYNITRSYLRSPTNHQPALLPAANQERTQSSQTNQSVKKSSTANDDKFKSSHRNESDLDLMFEVKKSKKPGRFVATVDFDTNTGNLCEYLHVKFIFDYTIRYSARFYKLF